MEYNEYGEFIRKFYYKEDKSPAKVNGGSCGYTREYDGKGNLIKISYLGENGEPSECESGYYVRTLK